MVNGACRCGGACGSPASQLVDFLTSNSNSSHDELGRFAAGVIESAKKVPDALSQQVNDGKLRKDESHKPLISDVWPQAQEDGTTGGLSFKKFKEKLVEAKQAGHLNLGRADLPRFVHDNGSGTGIQRVAKSEIGSGVSTFHTILTNAKQLVDNPARSEAQRRYLNSQFGHDWVKAHSFDNRGPLPEKVTKNMNKRCDECGRLESNCDCTRNLVDTSVPKVDTRTPMLNHRTDIRDILTTNSVVSLSSREGRRFNLFGSSVVNAGVGKVDTQPRHLETGQFLPKSGSSQKQTHSAVQKGASQEVPPNGDGTGKQDQGVSPNGDAGGQQAQSQQGGDDDSGLSDEAAKRGMSVDELKKQLGVDSKKGPTKNLARWFLSNL